MGVFLVNRNLKMKFLAINHQKGCCESMGVQESKVISTFNWLKKYRIHYGLI